MALCFALLKAIAELVSSLYLEPAVDLMSWSSHMPHVTIISHFVVCLNIMTFPSSSQQILIDTHKRRPKDNAQKRQTHSAIIIIIKQSLKTSVSYELQSFSYLITSQTPDRKSRKSRKSRVLKQGKIKSRNISSPLQAATLQICKASRPCATPPLFLLPFHETFPLCEGTRGATRRRSGPFKPKVAYFQNISPKKRRRARPCLHISNI